MADIVERLRDCNSFTAKKDMKEAAEEIEKLREEARTLHNRAEMYKSLFQASERRIDTFRGELKRADEQIRKMLSFEMFC